MEIYDVPQLAKMLRVCQRTVRTYLNEGRIIGPMVGKRWLVSEDALKKFFMQDEASTDDERLSRNVSMSLRHL